MSATFEGTCVCHVERTGIAYTNKTGTTPAQGHQVHRTPADDDRVSHGRQYQMQLKGPKGPVLQVILRAGCIVKACTVFEKSACHRLGLDVGTTSHQCCASCTGFQSRDESTSNWRALSSRLCLARHHLA